jgi:hypothetical protein
MIMARGGLIKPQPQPEQAVMPVQISPEEARLKQFYTKQYNIEADAFARNPMSQEQFGRGISKLQTKYKLAFNQAKMKIDQPDPAYKQWRDLDLYRNDLDDRLRDYNWITKRGKSVLQIWDPFKGKKGDWTTKGITTDQLEEAMTLTLERNRVQAIQTSLLQPGQLPGSLIGTAAVSPRMGGAIKDQAKAYLNQRVKSPQQQEPEDLSQLSDEELRRIVEGR